MWTDILPAELVNTHGDHSCSEFTWPLENILTLNAMHGSLWSPNGSHLLIVIVRQGVLRGLWEITAKNPQGTIASS